mmetsp:Transcript_6665/g.14555  ORF Transcript_6665/g.14555 Transcript_6665/m.14555 type:complete len:142 (-) Transcript_6665:1924-2349(-)
MRISTRFILIGTQHGENVGAAARAMKTMGFDDLALVAPSDPKVLHRHKVIKRANGANEVLKNAGLLASLDEAVCDRTVACDTGMPFGMFRTRQKRDYVEPRVCFNKLAAGAGAGEGGGELRLALDFGAPKIRCAGRTSKVY